MSKHTCYGLAQSGNGLALGVVRLSGLQENLASNSRNLMTWALVAAATVHLHTVFGDGAPGGPLEQVMPQVLGNMVRQAPLPSTVFDLAAAVVMLGWRPLRLPSCLDPANVEDAEGDAAMV